MLTIPASSRMPAVQRTSGFTIVELMITVAIIAILLAIAAPAMRNFIENGRIRSASESLQNGLTLARNEAVRQNRTVEFVRLPTGWVVRQPGSATPLHEAGGREGYNGIDLTIVPANADRITYDAFGRTVPNANDSASLERIDIASINPPSSGNYRPLSVQIQATGAPRLCNPKLADTDSKACL